MFKNNVSLAVMAFFILALLVGCNFSKDNSNNQDSPHNNQTEDTNNKPPASTKDPNDTSENRAQEKEVTLPNADFQKGDSGKPVQILQEFLNQIGYSIDVNGEFDKETTWALTDFQLQVDKLEITGLYNKATKEAIEKALANTIKIKPGKGLPYQAKAIVEGETEITTNPYEILVLVNKQHALPADFIPDDLVVPDVRFPFTEDLPKKQMRKPAADALEKMFKAADKEGLTIFAQSGFRSYDTQEVIFAANVAKSGEEEANKYSARPGESEHQSGLTMDVTNADVNFDLIIEFGDTPEGKWIKEHASEYGFIVRYPLGKEEITEYQYEPWHLRYVGVKAATEIMSKGITFEEYLGVK